MTHTSTEQPEFGTQSKAEYAIEVRNLKRRIAELEASQARVPLSDEQIEAAFKAAGGRWAENSYWVIEDADLHPFVRGITQEKQG